MGRIWFVGQIKRTDREAATGSPMNWREIDGWLTLPPVSVSAAWERTRSGGGRFSRGNLSDDDASRCTGRRRTLALGRQCRSVWTTVAGVTGTKHFPCLAAREFHVAGKEQYQ